MSLMYLVIISPLSYAYSGLYPTSGTNSPLISQANEAAPLQVSEQVPSSGDKDTFVVTAADVEEEEHTDELQPEPRQDDAIDPILIEIPAIGVHAAVEKTSLLENGEMGVPSDDTKVGWFEPGYQPGMPGNAVIAGHVDNKSGPAVFFYLKKLKPGDLILLSDGEGKQLTFSVVDTTVYNTEEAPLEQIFGSSDEPRLNLITCAGRYDRRTTQHEKRLVISATMQSG